MIENIHIQGYKKLADVNLQMRPLNVLIGENGSGKTSLLEVFQLLGAAYEGKLRNHLQSSITRILNPRSDSLSIKTQSVINDSSAFAFPQQSTHEIILKHNFGGYYIEKEYEYVRAGSGPFFFAKGLARRGEGIIKRIYLDTVFKINYEYINVNKFESMLELGVFEKLNGYKISTKLLCPIEANIKSSVRLPQTVAHQVTPGENGEYLSVFLHHKQQMDPEWFDTYMDYVRAVFPNVERMVFPHYGLGSLTLALKEEGYKEPFYVEQLSEGTIRFLWLAATLLNDYQPTTLLIDEPEMSLHPQMLFVLRDLLRIASQRTQVIVATHSERLVRGLDPDEVVICQVHEGQTYMHRASDPTLEVEKWLPDFDLNELWEKRLLEKDFDNRPDEAEKPATLLS